MSDKYSVKGFLRTGLKEECLGCEACIQVCGHKAISMSEDKEGFRYPVIVEDKCTGCGLCNMVCPVESSPEKNPQPTITFGGYAKDDEIRRESTSGGIFSVIADTWCKDDYVIFGAVADQLTVRHSYITDKSHIDRFRKSKYSQSIIGNSYKEAATFLKEGKNVIFSGTPCQIAGLFKLLSLRKTDTSRLLTIEVICEGVPSPLYMRKLQQCRYANKHEISSLDYRAKDNGARWDYEVMKIRFANGKTDKTDRWFNPFWSIWLQHLMSRPSCYQCPYTTPERLADITLGDLWGVHIYCPELYGDNKGASLVLCNTDKGIMALNQARTRLHGHDLKFEEAIRYQGPLRNHISPNPKREEFMAELENPEISFNTLVKKWAVKPPFKLILAKYIWGNHRKVRLWRLNRKLKAVFHIK